MTSTQPDHPRPAAHGEDAERAMFTGGAVVQLVTGDAATGEAMVVELLPATIVVTTRRVLALDGGQEWPWMVEDLEGVHHGAHEPWTILRVPGVDDHGVAVRPKDVVAFRAALDAVMAAEPEIALPTDAPTGVEVRPPLVDPGVDTPPRPSEPPAVDPTTTLPPRPPPIVTLADIEGTAPAHDDEGLAAGPAIDDVTRLGLPAPPIPAPDVTNPAPDVTKSDVTNPEVATPDGGHGRSGLRGRMGTRKGSAPASITAPQPLAALDAKAVSAWFGTHHVLDRVSLHMAPGQVTALIGPSGCGKSTFLRILNRMHEMIPSASLAGEVLLDGSDIYDAERKLTDARRQVGMVFQKPNPFPAMSIYDNVVASYRLTGTKISKEEKDDAVESCLSKAGLWTEVRDRLRSPGGGLSGGQQQRLCIARALAIKPRVLLMDEPCSALDPTSTRRIEETIMELGSEVTIVIVTHNMQQAARVSDQCAFFLAEQGTPGVIVEHGPTTAMFDHPQDPRTHDYVNGRFG